MINKKNSFLSKMFYCVFGSGFLNIINMVIVVLISRFLGPDDVGKYQLVVSSSVVLAALGSLGVTGAVVYFVCSLKYEAKLIYSIAVTASFFLGSCMFVASYFIFNNSNYFKLVDTSSSVIAALNVATLVVFSISTQMFVANSQIAFYQIAQSLPRIIFLVILCIWCLGFSFGFQQALFATTSSQLVGLFLILAYQFKQFKYKIRIDMQVMQRMVKYGFFVTLGYIVLMANAEAMNMILRFFINKDFLEIGYFSRAFRLNVLLLFFANALVPLLFSRFASITMKERVDQIHQLQRIWLVISFFLIFPLYLFAENIVFLLYSPSFSLSVPIFKILLVGSFFYSFIVFYNVLHSAAGNPVYISYVMGGNILMMLLLSCYVVPQYKGIGMAYVYDISIFLCFVVNFYICKIKYQINAYDSFFVHKEDIIYFITKVRSKFNGVIL